MTGKDSEDRIAALEAEVARLRQREEDLADSLENAAVALHWVAPDGAILWANQAELELMGYSRDEYIGRNIAEFYVDRPAIDDILRRLAANETLRDHETRLRRKDGGIRDVVITSTARREAGRFVHTRCFTRDITESKRADRERRETHEFLGALLNSSPLPVVVLTAEGNIMLWNLAAERVFGWSESEVAGKPLPFIPAEKMAEHRAMRAQDLAGRGFSEREIRRVRKDGQPIDLLVSTAHLHGPSGEVKAIISLYVDITERKRAHEELKESGDRLLFALDAGGMAAWDWTPATGSVNRTGNLCAEVGLRPGAGPDEFLALVHPDDRSRVADALERTAQTGQALNVEFRLALAGGSLRWMAHRGRVTSAPGTLVRVSGVMLDITNRKKAEEALRESEQRLQAILDNSTTVVYLKDLEGRYLLVNRRFEELFHIDRKDVLGKAEFDIFPEPHAQVLRANDQRVLEAGTACEFEELVPHDEGEHTYISIKFPIRNPHGEIYGICGISTDITERKRLEENLRQSAKLESLGVLAGGIAHDFNNLLVGILCNTSLIQQELSNSPNLREPLQNMLEASERAAQLTRQMLAYAGRGDFAVAPLDLSQQVRQITRLLEAALPKNVQLRLSLRDRLPAIDADAAQIQQLVMNLVINGAEAVGSGRGEVDVETTLEHFSPARLNDYISGAELPAGSYVALRVRDTGCGMDSATRARIFDPFFTTKFAGRGLGLSATMGIIRSHRGAIRVDTAPGRGSTFEILFPASSHSAEPVASGRVALPFRGSGLIVVVDDEPVVRRTATAALERHGYRVITAANGKEGLECIERHPADVSLVVLDLAMPVMGGEEALGRLRSRYPAIPVLGSSGYSEHEARERFGHGAAGFLQKPYTSSQLVAAVGAILSSGRAAGCPP